MKMPSYVLQEYEGQSKNSTIVERPEYSTLVRHFRMMDEHELAMFDHLKPASGHVMSSLVVEVRRYLPELQRFLEEDSRVKFIKKKINSLIELKDTADVVINCTGLASRHLVHDETVRPARGQVS